MRTQEQTRQFVAATLELMLKRSLPEGFQIILSDPAVTVPGGLFSETPPHVLGGIEIPFAHWNQLSDNALEALIAHEMANQSHFEEMLREQSHAAQFGDQIIWFETLRKMKVDAIALGFLSARNLQKEGLVEWIDFMRLQASHDLESVARFLRDLSFQIRHHHARALIDGRHDFASNLKQHVEHVANAISIAYSQPRLV